MLEKFIQAVIITFLLHLVVLVSSNTPNTSSVSASPENKPEPFAKSILLSRF